MLSLAKIGVGLILFFVASQMVVLIGAKAIDGENDDDLFAPYAEIMPGTPTDIFLPKWRASCDQVYPGTTTQMICHLKTTEGYFPSGYVYVRNNTIDSIAFSVTGLTVGDLAKRWGNPRIESMGASGDSLHWNTGSYEVIVQLRGISQYSYWSPVTILAVTKGQS